jgi:DNA uptake protein ComE-like DNA-binding protein
MKKFSFKPVLNWFGFTRRERRSTFLLLILILFVAGFRFIIPEHNITVEKIPVKKGDMIVTSFNEEKENGSGSYMKNNRSNPQRPLLEINTCDSASLEALPGIGTVLSARIIKFRKLLGGFVSVNQLREVYGLSEEVFNIISSRVYADSTAVRKIIINSAEYKELIRLPYFEKYEVTAILKYRELKGSIKTMDEMIDNKLIAREKTEKIRPYLEFEEK